MLARRVKTAWHILGERKVVARYENENVGQIMKGLVGSYQGVWIHLESAGESLNDLKVGGRDK